MTILSTYHPGIRTTLEAMDIEASIRRMAEIHRSVPAGLILEAAQVRAEIQDLEEAGLVGVA